MNIKIELMKEEIIPFVNICSQGWKCQTVFWTYDAIRLAIRVTLFVTWNGMEVS